MEQLFSLIIVADVFVALFVILGLVQSIRANVKTGCLSQLLVFGAVASFLAVFVMRTINEIELDPQEFIALVGGMAAFILFGLLFLILDMRKESYKALYSRGLFSIFTGFLLLGAFFFIPVIPQQIIQIPTATPITDAVLESVADANIIPTEAMLPTVTDRPSATPTMTRTPLPAATATPTRRVYVPPTITPTLVNIPVEDDCGATVLSNLNVREYDDVNSDIVAIIPEGRYINILGKNDDNSWYLTEFEAEQGWVVADFLQLDSICFVER